MSRIEKLRGGWALVTGASAGLGEEYARQLAARGMHLVLTARRADRLETLAASLRSAHGVSVEIVVADLAAEDGVAAVTAACAAREIDVLVNNAGFGFSGRFADADPEQDARMVRLNCGAVTSLAHAFLPPMLARKRGAMIVVASVAGFQPTPWFSVYGATKAFDLHLAEALWSETRGTGVDVLAVAPGSTKTEFSTVAHFDREPQGLDPAFVVRASLDRVGRGGPTFVPGWKDKALAFLHRFFPRGFTANVTGAVLAKDLLRATPEDLRKR